VKVSVIVTTCIFEFVSVFWEEFFNTFHVQSYSVCSSLAFKWTFHRSQHYLPGNNSRLNQILYDFRPLFKIRLQPFPIAMVSR